MRLPMNPNKKQNFIYPFIFVILTLSGLFCQVGTSISSETETALLLPDLDLEFEPKLGTYYYNAEWNFINVGKASIKISKEDNQYKMVVNAQTNKKIDIIYKLRYRGESIMSAEYMEPISVNMKENIKSKKKNTTMEFKDDGTIKTTESKKKRGRREKKSVTEIQRVEFHLDPFSATCLVRRLDWEVGVADVFDIVLGADTYELKLMCTEKTTIEIAEKEREAYIIVPELSKKGEEEKKSSNGNLRIFLSADELKEVLKIDASHKLGTFKVVLEKFVPKENSPEKKPKEKMN